MNTNLKIREYAEEEKVEITNLKKEDGINYKMVISEESYKAHLDERLVIVATNEGGHNCTQVDLIDLLVYVKTNLPEIWKTI